MQRWIPILGGALVVQLLLAGALAMRSNPLTSTVPDSLLVSAEAKNADKLVIESKPSPNATDDSGRIELVKKNGKWVLPAQFDAPANAAKVDEILEKFATVKRGLPIATSKAALKRFKVTDEEFERRVTLAQGDKELGKVYLGTSSGVRKSDARTAKDEAVYAVDLPTYDLSTQTRDWFNGDLLERKAEDYVEVTIAKNPRDQLKLVRDKAADKQSGPWRAEGLAAGKQLDSAHAETLATTVANLRVEGVVGTENKPEWQQDKPLLTLTLKDTKGEAATWTLSKPASGDFHVLKSSAHPWYFSVDESTAKSLIDAGDRGTLVTDATPAKEDGKSAG